jgi:hypothetical protein
MADGVRETNIPIRNSRMHFAPTTGHAEILPAKVEMTQTRYSPNMIRVEVIRGDKATAYRKFCTAMADLCTTNSIGAKRIKLRPGSRRSSTEIVVSN